MSPRLTVFVVLVVLAGGLAVTAYGDLPGRRVLPAGEARFDVTEVTWAQGSTLHQGARTYDIGAGVVRGMLATPHGFFVSLRATLRRGDTGRLVFFDGQTVADVPGRVPGGVTAVAVSPDGRYAGWVDREGPWSLAGRIAEVVVVDLQTGHAVFRDHENMGGAWGDDLLDRYEELEPLFLGFDDEGRAYWQDASGHGERWRVDLASGEKENVEGDYGDGTEHTGPLGEPASGTVSPGGRFVLGSAYRQRVQVTDAVTGRRVRLDHGRRNAFFGGWQDGSTLYALVTDDYRTLLDGTLGPDPSTGTLVSCALPSGRCTELREVHRLRSFTFGLGDLELVP